MANQPKKYKKFVATAATATLVASAIVPVASAAGFSDVAGSDHEVAINTLADAGIINGYADGTFKPTQSITRGQVVKLLGRWLEAQGQEIPADWDTKQRFNDLSVKGEEELVKYAALAKDAGVFAGSNGNLNASQNITRQQMAVVLVRAIKEIAGVDLVAEYKEAGFVTEITDLEKAYAAEQRNAIVALEYAGLTNVSNFRPTENLQRGQFASFLYRTIENVVNAPVAGVSGIKAINATTVEVTFDEEVDNVQALNFLISDLEVKNAAVKQTNKKVVVLTTAAQTADKEYTVSVDDEKVGTFKGIGAVVPTSIKLLTSNTQGKVGNQVTLKADIGVKAAGVPVTFNVDAPTGSLNKDAVVEVVTDAEGIATYSYTQYAPDADDVTVYPTGAPQLRSFGTVYWGVDNILTIEEVTTGNVLANGVKKTYKVTFKDPKTGVALSNRAINVSFVENTNVAFNAISKATVTNPSTGVTVTPYQAITGYSEEIKVTTDSNGQATFVVSGTNTAVTPYVFVDGSSSVLGVSTVTGTNNVTQATTANKKWEATELTATAAQVKFEGAQLNNQITVTRDGEEEAAAQFGSKLNGREYKVKVLDKDGKAYANGLVNIGLDEVLDRNISTVSNAKFANVTDGKAFTPSNANAQQGQIKLDSKGEATVILYGAKGEVGTPLVWIDQNTAQNNQSGVLEDGEPFFKAPASNFQYERVIGAEFKVEGKTSNQNVTADGIANYTFALTNQSGEALERLAGKMTYEIRNTSGQPIVVKTPIAFRDQNNVSATSFSIQEYGSITITADVLNTANAAFTIETAPNGKAATVVVTPSFVTTNNFDASADNGVTTDARDFNKYVTAAGLTATFGNSVEVGTSYTGVVQYINKADSGSNSNSIWFNGKNPVKYAGTSGKTFKYFSTNGEVYGEAAWEALLDTYIGGTNAITVSYNVDGDTITFKIVNVSPGTAPTAPPSANNAPVGTGASFTYALTGGNQTVNITSLATDADGDALSFVGAISSSNASVATASVTGGNQLVITPGTTAGSTTFTVNVTDSKVASPVPVTFTVNVTAGKVTVNGTPAGAPVIAYADATPTAGSQVITTPTVTTDGTLSIVVNGDKTLLVDLVTTDTVATMVAKINTEATTAGLGNIATATNTGADITITSNTTGTSSTVLASGVGTLAGNVVDNIQAATAGTAGTATKAVYSFSVVGQFTDGQTVTVELGGITKTYTAKTTPVVATDFAIGSNTTDAAQNLAAKINADFAAKFVVANASNTVTLTQVTAADTNNEVLKVNLNN